MSDLERHFSTMYDKFKLMLYDRALKERGRSMPGDLSLQEVIYMEIIIALGTPSVAEFSRYAKLSAPNTAYRLNKLEEKGYIRRTRNDRDKREFMVEATNRYRDNTVSFSTTFISCVTGSRNALHLKMLINSGKCWASSVMN